jgi:beta-lactam-binding protein with PASTA domain
VTVAEASAAAGRQGLHLRVENRFYSSEVPEGHVIAQDPAPGFHVRRDWPIRITESLGSQRVSIPDLVGQSERAAMITIRQLGLEPGAVVRMPAPGESDVVIAQTPSPQAGQASSPRISLLVSDPDSAETPAYVMPSLVGLSYAAAAARAASAGLHLIAAEEVSAPPVNTGGPPAAIAAGVPVAVQTTAPTATPAAPSAPAGPAAPPTSGTVVAQMPPPGHRVQQGDAVHITVTHTSSSE